MAAPSARLESDAHAKFQIKSAVIVDDRFFCKVVLIANAEKQHAWVVIQFSSDNCGLGHGMSHGVPCSCTEFQWGFFPQPGAHEAHKFVAAAGAEGSAEHTIVVTEGDVHTLDENIAELEVQAHGLAVVHLKANFRGCLVVEP